MEVLLPQPEIDYGYLGAGYMFPRSDGIFFGSTFEPDNWSLEINPAQSTHIINTHTEMMKGLR